MILIITSLWQTHRYTQICTRHKIKSILQTRSPLGLNTPRYAGIYSIRVKTIAPPLSTFATLPEVVHMNRRYKNVNKWHHELTHGDMWQYNIEMT